MEDVERQGGFACYGVVDAVCVCECVSVHVCVSVHECVRMLVREEVCTCIMGKTALKLNNF